VKKLFLKLEANFEPVMMIGLFYSLLLLLTVQILLRTFADGGFSWAEEICRFIFVWLMYFAISYATRNQRHIKVRFFSQLFGRKIEKYISIVADLFFLLFSVVMFISATKLVREVAEFGDKAISVNISMNFLYGAGLIGLLLMIIRVAQGVIWKIKNFNEPIERFENVMGVYFNELNLLSFLKDRKKNEAKPDKYVMQKGGDA
jgi:TRAP-type C4-dicarboxylate transport system permease small subunit